VQAQQFLQQSLIEMMTPYLEGSLARLTGLMIEKLRHHSAQVDFADVYASLIEGLSQEDCVRLFSPLFKNDASDVKAFKGILLNWMQHSAKLQGPFFTEIPLLLRDILPRDRQLTFEHPGSHALVVVVDKEEIYKRIADPSRDWHDYLGQGEAVSAFLNLLQNPALDTSSSTKRLPECAEKIYEALGVSLAGYRPRETEDVPNIYPIGNELTLVSRMAIHLIESSFLFVGTSFFPAIQLALQMSHSATELPLMVIIDFNKEGKNFWDMLKKVFEEVSNPQEFCAQYRALFSRTLKTIARAQPGTEHQSQQREDFLLYLFLQLFVKYGFNNVKTLISGVTFIHGNWADAELLGKIGQIATAHHLPKVAYTSNIEAVTQAQSMMSDFGSGVFSLRPALDALAPDVEIWANYNRRADGPTELYSEVLHFEAAPVVAVEAPAVTQLLAELTVYTRELQDKIDKGRGVVLHTKKRDGVDFLQNILRTTPLGEAKTQLEALKARPDFSKMCQGIRSHKFKDYFNRVSEYVSSHTVDTSLQGAFGAAAGLGSAHIGPIGIKAGAGESRRTM
jgi:hypothetical protein